MSLKKEKLFVFQIIVSNFFTTEFDFVSILLSERRIKFKKQYRRYANGAKS